MFQIKPFVWNTKAQNIISWHEQYLQESCHETRNGDSTVADKKKSSVVAEKLLIESVECYVEVMADQFLGIAGIVFLERWIDLANPFAVGARLEVMRNWNREAYSDPTITYMQSLRLRICTISVYCASQ